MKNNKIFYHKNKELTDYINNMLQDISTEKNKSLIGLHIEYSQLSDMLYNFQVATNNYKPLTELEEIAIYEASLEAIFDKYVI